MMPKLPVIYSDRLEVVQVLKTHCNAQIECDRLCKNWWKIYLPEQWQTSFRSVLHEYGLTEKTWTPF